MTKCKNWKRYKGIKKPTCLDGAICDSCGEKYAANHAIVPAIHEQLVEQLSELPRRKYLPLSRSMTIFFMAVVVLYTLLLLWSPS